MEYIITAIITGGMFGFIEFLIKRHDEKRNKGFVTKKDFVPIEAGILAILQERLESMMTKYLERGEITTTQFKTLETLLKAYENLGGDGFIHTLYEQVKDLL